MAQEVQVEEVRAIVGVEAQQLEGQSIFHLPGRLDYPVRPLVPNRTVGRPSAVDVGIGHAPDEIPIQAASAVGHRVCIQEARTSDVPVICPDRDLGLQ